jgi:hypothetical protein
VSIARYFVSTALPAALSAAAASSGDVLVSSLPGTWPASYPFTVLIDWGTVTQEAVSVTSAPTGAGSGPYTLPCTRGIDNTTAQAHATGAPVIHGVSGQDFNDVQAHIQGYTSGTSGTGNQQLHGLDDGSAVVGTTDTQTLTNKTLGAGTTLPPGTGLDWVNITAPPYSAAGDGSTDDTTAIQAALTAAETSGGVIYFPAGQYVISSTVEYNSDKPVMLIGDIANGLPGGGSEIIWNSSNAIDMIFVTGAQVAAIRDLVIYPASGVPTSSSAGSVALHVQSVHSAFIERVKIIQGAGAGYSTTGILADTNQKTFIENCEIDGYAQAVWMTAGQLCTISNSTLTTVAGSGSGAVRMDNGAQSLALLKAQSQGGDRGLYMVAGAGSNPGFISVHDFSANNPAVAGIELDAGSQFKASGMFLSGSGSPAGLSYGVIIGSGFTGQVEIIGGTVQDFSGHGIWVQGGSGYMIADSIIGGMGTETTNTYDDIHIAAGVAKWSVTNCHFDIDPFLGFRVGGTPRSAVYVESGASAEYLVAGNIFASGYATQPVINLATGATGAVRGNVGWNPVGPLTAPGVPSSGTPLANPFALDCSVYVTGGTITAISVGGTATGVTSGLVRVPASQSVTLTYTGSPSWTWFGD